jgi:hypothetical protein
MKGTGKFSLHCLPRGKYALFQPNLPASMTTMSREAKHFDLIANKEMLKI